jgi:hypothetical protein
MAQSEGDVGKDKFYRNLVPIGKADLADLIARKFIPSDRRHLQTRVILGSWRKRSEINKPPPHPGSGLFVWRLIKLA